MISIDTYETLSRDYGHLSSWALWDNSDIGNLDILKSENFDSIRTLLKPEIVLVALNVSALLPNESFANFHSANTEASKRPLEKLRNALGGTVASGAYITDIIKYRNIFDQNEKREIFEDSNSTSVQKALSDNSDLLNFNLKIFHQELKSLDVKNKVLIALGGAAEKYLKKYLEYLKKCGKADGDTAGHLAKIYHYSYRFKGFHELPKYKEHVEKELSELGL